MEFDIKMGKNSYRLTFKPHAFTLAEVLITLGIIGIVAAMTIPTMMNNIGDAQFKTAYKKAYSEASQAVNSCMADNSFVARTGWGDATNNATNWDAFRAKFNVTLFCDGTTVTIDKCWDMTGEKFNNGTAPLASGIAFIDQSGKNWVRGTSGFGPVYTGDVLVDTNGFKQPNKFGQDRFRLTFTAPDGSIATAGIPSRVMTDDDFPTYNATYCRSGNSHPCYYKSWLYNN